MEVTKSDIEKAYGGPFVEYAIQKFEEYKMHITSRMEWDELKRLARLGAALEAKMKAAAEDDDGHHAHLTYRCFGEGEDCGHWQWYVWQSQDSDQPVLVKQLGNTAQEALDLWKQTT